MIDRTDSFGFQMNGNGGSDNFAGLVKEFQVEFGNKATSYHPAYEDIDARMTATETRIEQSPDEINLAVSEGIEGLEIGGTNLVSNEREAWGGSGSKDFRDDGTIYLSNPNQAEWGNFTSNKSIEVAPGESLTFSFQVLDINKTIKVQFRNTGGGSPTSYKSATIPNKKGKFVHTYKNTSNESIFISPWITLYANDGTNDGTQFIHIKHIKVEKGSVATDFSLAEEDRVNKTNVLSSINLSTEGVKIQGAKIDIAGLVTVLNADGSAGTMINGGKIVGQSITANQLNINNIFGNSAVIAKIQSDSVRTANLNASRINTGTLNGNDVNVTNLSASNLVTGSIDASKIRVSNLNASEIKVGDLTGINIFGSTIKGTNIYVDGDMPEFLYSNALDTNPETQGIHVYVRPKVGGEVRATVTNTTTQYVPIRASAFISAPKSNANILTDNELRVQNIGQSGIYRDVRAEIFRGAGFTTRTTNAYIGADEELRVVSKNTVGDTSNAIYRNVRANIYRGVAIDLDGTTNATHFYVRPSATGRLRVTSRGTTDSWRPVQAQSYLLPSGSSAFSGLRSSLFNLPQDNEGIKIINKLETIRYTNNNNEAEFKIVDFNGVDVGWIAENSVRAIQELSFQNDELQTENEQLKSRLDVIEEQLEQLLA